ncbi:hypothetical protein PC112_g10924 [Phytophthora cactorum]|nr:hypothetical protein PC112_g10924 [Phytophthora cactorum]KAG3063207.1 hypothetical protein PC121_g12289 [Phytophthora cactorum]KAG3146207.1 hypothetical protein PC128_g24051 [Phytophthora cactorum]KAG4040876.1 hypothetical protein PC123_g23593 [Phytophthora cactorum]
MLVAILYITTAKYPCRVLVLRDSLLLLLCAIWLLLVGPNERRKQVTPVTKVLLCFWQANPDEQNLCFMEYSRLSHPTSCHAGTLLELITPQTIKLKMWCVLLWKARVHLCKHRNIPGARSCGGVRLISVEWKYSF